jgi:hypothetical protein
MCTPIKPTLCDAHLLNPPTLCDTHLLNPPIRTPLRASAWPRCGTTCEHGCWPRPIYPPRPPLATVWYVKHNEYVFNPPPMYWCVLNPLSMYWCVLNPLCPYYNVYQTHLCVIHTHQPINPINPLCHTYPLNLSVTQVLDPQEYGAGYQGYVPNNAYPGGKVCI